MRDKTEQNRHENLLRFVKSAYLAYSVFAVLLIIAKFCIEANITFLEIFIYIFFYSLVSFIFYLLIKKEAYLKINIDKNFFVIPSLVGILLGQYYFFILGNARWIYTLVLSVSYLGVTYQSYKVVLLFSLSSATLNLLIVGAINIFELQKTNLAQDLMVVLIHYIISFFMIPITRFFNVISENYRNILHVLRERNHIIEKDLELAYTIQKSLLPAEYPKYSNIKFASKYIPMDIVGGDFYEFINIDEKEVGIFISDVSGHGVPAALITSMIKVAVSSINPRYLSKPAKFFQLINDALIDKTATNFITAFYGIYNTETKLFRYSNAGHCSPLLYKKKTNEMIPLRADGILLGIFSGVGFEEKSIQLDSEDKIIFYTDGLIETMNKERKLYGFDGLVSFTEKNNSMPISAYIHCLYDDVCDWALTKNFEDDIVIIGIEIL